MGKSIRSKIKRKHRKEFRETIGADAFKKNMDKVQVKLQECVKKGNLNSFERLSNALSTGPIMEDEMETGNEPLPQDVETSPSSTKGENKVPTKKRREQKHRIRKKPREERTERRKPKYYCQF